MSFLAAAFRSETKKLKDPAMSSEVSVPIGYPTTFLPLDYRNGMYNVVESVIDDTTYENYSIGVGDGSIIQLIGKAGTAKTTFAMQMATSIVAPFKNSVVIHDDLERGASKTRIANVTGWRPRRIEQQYILRQSGITAENFYARVKLHCDMKIQGAIANPEELTYFTGLYDSQKKPVYKIIPSVYILDSLALLMPGQYADEEELSGQMSTTASAKANSSIFRRIAPALNQANVILILVNHVNQAVNIKAIPQQAQINYMKQDETIPGGFMSLYLSNNIFKFITSDKLYDDKAFGINGFVSKIQIIKSRTNRAGQEFKMIYNQDTGFDRILSMYQMLKDEDLVRGASTGMYIDGLPEIKFSQKRLIEKFYNEEKLRYVFRELVTEVGESYIPKRTFDSVEEMTEDELAMRLIESYCDSESA